MLESEFNRSSWLIKSRKTFSLGRKDFRELFIDVLQGGSAIRFRAKGLSMSPLIKDKDIVTVVPIQKTAPKLGDVIAYLKPESHKIVIHRLIKKYNGFFITKGDNALECDSSFTASHILGIVSRVERNHRKLLLGLGPERGLVALLSQSNLVLNGYRFFSRTFHILKPKKNG